MRVTVIAIAAIALVASGPLWSFAQDDCERVAETERIEKYDTAFYRSKGLAFFPELTNPKPYCQVFKAEKEVVSRIVIGILPKPGNPIAVSDVANGIFTTNTIERGHLTARWQDSYSITVQEEERGKVIVRVLRTLQIYRGDRKQSKQMRQHPSDGHNEKWIFTQIATALASHVTTPASPGAVPTLKTDSGGDIEAKLTNLQQLRERGVISDDEYQGMRKRVLEGFSSPPAAKP